MIPALNPAPRWTEFGSPAGADMLVPDPQVWRELGVTSMTGWRWDQDKKLGFPPAVKIRGRKYRSRRALDEWRERMFRDALQSREAAA